MKAKLSIKKALSLIVVLVMLLTMIPAGMISVGAEEATIDLSNYDFDTEYVIMNVEDWFLIAREAQDKDFSGKTVKLGADLDFGAYTQIWDAAHAPASGEFPNPMYSGSKPSTGNEIAVQYAATVPTLFNNFAGVFDGDGYTISNAKFEEGGIARRTLDGAEISNVTFENVSATDYYDYFGYGIVVGEVTGSFWMENVHVVDSAIFGDTFNTFHFGSAGALIGLVSAAEGVEDAYVGIFDCSVDADVACGNYAGWGYGYGTGIAIGTVDSNVDLEMAYCSFGGTINSQDWYAGAIGVIYVGNGRSVAINDITIDGLTMNTKRGAITDGVQSWGSLVGAISTYDNASVTIDRVTATNVSIITTSHAAGGLLGMIQPLNSPAVVGGPVANNSAGAAGVGRLYSHETVEDVSVAISNIYVDAYLWTNTNTTGTAGAAGLVSQIGQGNATGEAIGRVMKGEINIYNCYLAGTYINSKYDATLDTWTVVHGAGGIFHNVSLAEATTNVSNVVVDAIFPQEPQYIVAPEGIAEADDATKKAYSAEVAKCVGLIAHGGHVRQKTTGDYVATDADGYLESYLNVSDVATTLRGDFNLFSWLNRKGGIYYNGEDIARGDKAAYAPPVENDGSIVQVRPIEAKQMVQLDADGFVTRVTGALGLIGVQAAGDDVRFIASAYIDSVASATATVTFTDAEYNEKTFTFDAVSLLDGLTAVEGTDIAEYDADDFYAKKLMAVTIKNIPADTEYSVSWSFEYTTEDGVTVKSETASGILLADGSFELY